MVPIKLKKRLLLWLLISPPFLAFIAFSPQFLFQRARISNELNKIVESIPLDISWEGVKIADYRGRWNSMYAKLELSTQKYSKVKQRFLLFEGSVSSKDFTHEILSEQYSYRYNEKYFLSTLSLINNVKRLQRLSSMSLDEYEELLIMETTYGKLIGMTTGGRFMYWKERTAAVVISI